MASKCIISNLHLHPHLSLHSSTHQNKRFSCLPPTIKFKTNHNQIHHWFPNKRCAIWTPRASSSSSSSSSGKHDEFDPHPTLINKDLKPTTPSQRNYKWWQMAKHWIGLVVGVPAYYMAGSLVDFGMAWWQGIATVVAANVILLVPLVLTGHPGTKYGIPFPVLARSSFGIRGSHVPTSLSAMVGCGWYAIESWIGGEAVYLFLPNSMKQSSYAHVLPWLGTSPLEFACFIAFWSVQLVVVWKGMEGVKAFEKFAAPILMVLTCFLLVWAYVKAAGFGHMLTISSRLSNSEFWSLFFPSLTANISFWATIALNIPDFTRFAKTQKDQIIGQAGLPIFMGVFTFIGLAVTCSTQVIFGHVITSPIQLLGRIGGLQTTILAILGVGLATMTTNIAANIVAPANALVNLRPSVFNYRRGALLTALLCIAFQPWRLLKSSESFVYTWLVGYSALLGPIGGIVLSDYYLIRQTKLSLKDLYSLNPDGAYYYSGGFNLAAIVALVSGILPVIPGFLEKVGILSSVHFAFVVIYNNAWFFSFFSAGLIYWILSSLRGEQNKALPFEVPPTT